MVKYPNVGVLAKIATIFDDSPYATIFNGEYLKKRPGYLQWRSLFFNS